MFEVVSTMGDRKSKRLPSCCFLAALGFVLILTGVFISPLFLIESIRTIPPQLQAQLMAGAALLKVSLVLCGLFVLGIASFWARNECFPAAKPSAECISKRELLILVSILAGATMLRLYKLGAGLWHDEILTYVNYAKLPFAEIVTTYGDQNQHFMYTLLAHASLLLFGDNPWSLRFPAVLFGVGSIGVLYLFGCQVATRRESMLASALVALSYHHVWFSQNARGYIGLLFWTLLASWLFLRAQKEEQPRLWLFYGAAAALGVYTNTAMLFVILGHFIIFLGQVRIHGRNWPSCWTGFFLGFCSVGFLTLLLHALVLPQMVAGVEESIVPAWKQPLWAVQEFFGAIRLGFTGIVAALAALLVFGMGLWSFARTQLAVVQLMILPALACATAVIVMGYHVWPRLFFFTFGFAALIIVRGAMVAGENASRLLKTSPRGAVRMGTSFAVGLIFLSAASLPRAYFPKQDFLAALNFIEAKKAPEDAVAMVGLVAFAYKNLYARDWQEIKTLEELESVRSHSKHTWLLYTFPTHMRAVYPDIMRTINKDFEIVKQFPGTIGDGLITVARSSGRPS